MAEGLELPLLGVPRVKMSCCKYDGDIFALSACRVCCESHLGESHNTPYSHWLV